MTKNGDMALAEKIAEASVRLVKEYIKEMRRQGRIKGELTVTVKDGRRKIRVPYPE